MSMSTVDVWLTEDRLHHTAELLAEEVDTFVNHLGRAMDGHREMPPAEAAEARARLTATWELLGLEIDEALRLHAA